MTNADIIKDTVDRIVMVMKEGKFTKDELVLIKKIFEQGLKATNNTLAKTNK